MNMDFKHCPIREGDIKTFITKTGQTRQTAIEYLMADKWRLYLAIEAWSFDQAWKAKQQGQDA